MAGKKGEKQKTYRFNVDVSEPVKDDIVVTNEFVDFLKTNIKVENKKGELGDLITVTSKGTMVTVNATIPFSKRYLKYLTKKYLKKIEILDYLKVNAVNKSTYKVKYVKIDRDEENQE